MHRGGAWGCKLLLLILAFAAPATLITTSSTARTAPSALTASKRHAPRRVGGRVHAAWPRVRGRAPRTALARWMARQVGPTQVKPCRRLVKRHLVRCHRAKPPRRGVVLPGASADLGAGAHLAGDGAIASVASVPTGSTTLELTRSYNIPTDDPSYARLLNWSWTYDSAMSAVAFVVNGYSAEAEQLLDQLAALQHTDGSVEIAFDVATGTAEPVFRSGTIATMGLAGALYDLTVHSSRYLQMEERAAGYLLSLQGSSGLIRGGPDVSWYSTQHNLLAYSFLGLLAAELIADGNHPAANTYSTAANKISSGIESSLLVHNGGTAYFIEGLGDSVQSLDADALGAMYLQGRNESTVAQEVLAYANSAFALSGRSILKSSNPLTYNETYSAAGPFSGFKPYLGTGAPNVLWTEGSAEMLLAQESLGSQSATALSQSLGAIAALTPTQAPVQSDQVAVSVPYGAEYHVWPSAAAGAWVMLAARPAQALLFGAG